jgi:hypothetical protein
VNASAQTYISPRLTLWEGGETRVVPIEVVALDGAPIHDNGGNRLIESWDTTKTPLLLATANRVEFLVDAPPPGATLYLDSEQVTPGCAADGIPAAACSVWCRRASRRPTRRRPTSHSCPGRKT